MDHNLRAVEAIKTYRVRCTKKWNNAYKEAYDRLPKDVGGVMLREAVDSLSIDDLLDDIIISAYADGDREAAVTALFMLLDSWRKRQAERIADKEAGE